jgi:uncharacterized protein YndB with AHSA1/START domain
MWRAVDPFTVTATVARPREEVFEYLADIANHAEFTDHFLKDFRLTREQSYGRGAGARYRVNMPLNRFPWADTTIVEFDPPYRLVEQGRAGKYNRIKVSTEYRLLEGAGDTTRVELTSETEPALVTDRLLEKLGARGWLRRQNRRALRRLQSILEDNELRGRRATLAG